MGTVVYSSTGRPHAKCPTCGRIHPVMRRKDYLDKPVIRFQCKNKACGTSWRATPDEKQQIQDYYKKTQEAREVRRQRALKGIQNRQQAAGAEDTHQDEPKRGGLFSWLLDDD